MPASEFRHQYHIKPGPKYMLHSTVGFNNHDPTLKRSPAYSLGFRYALPNEPKCSYFPSANTYNTNGLVRNGPLKTKGGALGYRTENRISYGPSALSYSPDFKKQSTIKSVPSASLGNRSNLIPNTGTPGANTYMIPHSIGKDVTHLKTAPAYSILGRRHRELGSHTPHPLSYPAVNCDIYKKKPPECSVKGPFIDKNLTTGSKTPGANAYLPLMVHMKNPPSVLFGVKGNSYIPKSMMDNGFDDIHVESHELDPL